MSLVDDSKKLQVLQLGALADETLESAEHHQPYGFSAVPVPGAEAVVVFPGGDRSHPLVVAVSDRRYRPTGGVAGEVTLYNKFNARVILKADGTIEAKSSSGTAVSLATKADIDALKTWAATHLHAGVTAGAAVSGVPSVAPPNAAGTTKLKGE